jgi:MinD-like ATPase involved in chromosome partitioning or flagellar assembly
VSGSRSVIVLGIAGGVGATTAAAMIAAGLAGTTGPLATLVDRTGGRLACRIPEVFGTFPSTTDVSIHDLGHHVTDEALIGLLDSRPVLVVATAASAPGEKRAAERARQVTRLAGGSRGLPTPLIVATQVFGRDSSVPAARNAQYRVHPIPWDRALASGGQINTDALDRSTTHAYEALVSAVSRALDSVGQ